MYTREQALLLSKSAIIAYLQGPDGQPIKKLMARNVSGYSKMNAAELRKVFADFCDAHANQKEYPVLKIRKLPVHDDSGDEGRTRVVPIAETEEIQAPVAHQHQLRQL